MLLGLFASALVPALSEEAIRSSYLFYLADRGRRKVVVLSLAAVFVVGEVIHDVSIYPAARDEVGLRPAAFLLAIALLTGILLHIALTLWTAKRQRGDGGVWSGFLIALAIHTVFNLAGRGVVSAFE
jgi:hypothetical protein